MIGHKGGEVESVTTKEWDVKGEYDAVLDTVKKAAGGASDVKIYRLEQTKTRLEYYVVALDQEHSRIVGLKTKAVES